METIDIKIKPRLSFTLKKCGDVVPYGITPEEKAKLAEYPELTGDPNKFVSDDGTVKEITSSIGVVGTDLYASVEPSTLLAGAYQLKQTIDPTETEMTIIAGGGAIVSGAKFIDENPAQSFPMGTIGFDYWRKISSLAGEARKGLRFFLFDTSDNSEIDIFAPLWSSPIEATDFAERQISYSVPAVNPTATQHFGVEFLFTASASDITLTYIVGDGRGWFMRLPLPLKHESLTDKNSEAAWQHIDTTITKHALDAADMVAIKDSVTGKMVLAPKTELAGNTNLLYEYVHSGNKEVYISSIDYSTNTFTSVNHGLVNGDRLGLKIISDGIIENVIPFTDAIPQTASTTGYYVINSAGDTFQISATSGGAAITTINKATHDFSKWRFEVLIAQNILLPNIPSIGCEIEVIGDIMQLNRYVYENSYPSLSSGYVQSNVTSSPLIHANNYLLKGWYCISIRKTGTSMFVNRKYVGVQLDTTNSARIKWVTAEIIMQPNGDISLIDNIQLTAVILTNGTIINVYKI